MSDHAINLIDRLRIERVVWALDQQIYDLPRAARISTRREVRQNLRAAARDVGTTEAIRRLGGSRALANEYLTAEFGVGPRHSWMAAAFWVGLVPLVLTSLLTDAADTYRQGIVAAAPATSGTYTWSGIAHVQTATTFTFDQGTMTSMTGGDWVTRPLPWIILLGGAILVGRLWRLLPVWRRRRIAG